MLLEAVDAPQAHDAREEPSTSAPLVPTKPQAGVIATRPATAPDAAPSIDGLPFAIHSPNIHDSTAAAVASSVLMNASAAVSPASSADPALNPNQPTHSSDAPIIVNVQVVRRHRFLAVADALADHVSAHQAGDAGVDVHHRAAREVERALLPEPAALRGFRGERRRILDAVGAGPEPDHVRDRQVGEREPERGEQQHRRELHALGERADDEADRDRRERRLEHDVQVLGNHHALAERRRGRERSRAVLDREDARSGTADRSRRRTRCPR